MSSNGSGFPATSSLSGISSSSLAVATSTARSADRAATRPCVAASASPKSTPSGLDSRSNVSYPKNAAALPTSISTSKPIAVKRSSNTATAATGGNGPPWWPMSSPIGLARCCATSAKVFGFTQAQVDGLSKYIDSRDATKLRLESPLARRADRRPHLRPVLAS